MRVSLGIPVRLSRPIGSPYADDALAFVPTSEDYWASGAQYTPLSAMPGYAFTRSGEQGAIDSTGLVEYFAANVPAINDRGYHAYGALTNLALQSQALNGAPNTAGNVSMSANTTVAPDGTTTGDTLTATAGSTAHQLYQNIGAATAAVYTQSVFAKMGTCRWLGMSFDASAAAEGAFFDLQNGVVGTVAGGTSAYIVSMGSGWYRCVITRTLAAATKYTNMEPHSADAQALTWNAAGTETIHLWQSQILLGNFPDGGPIIRTTAATASIGASALTLGLANGTYDATYTFDDDSTQNNAALNIADGALNLPTDFAPNRNIIKSLLVS